MKICKKCNIEYSDDKKFCRSCGNPLDSMSALETADSAKKEVLEERLKSDPLNIELLQEYASFLLNIKLYEESIKASFKILAIDKNNITAKKTLLDAYIKLDQLDKAESIGKQLLLEEPNEISHLQKMAEIAIKLKNWDKAIDYLDDILSKQPSDIVARYEKMKVFIEMGKLLVATDTAKTLYHDGVRDKTTTIYAGIADALEGEYAKAIELLKTTLKNEDFESENILYHRGLLYLTYSLCKNNTELAEIEQEYLKLDSQFIKKTSIPTDKETAVSVVEYIVCNKLEKISDKSSAKNEIDTLISLYLNRLPGSDKNNITTAELWYLIGIKQKEHNLINQSFNSFQKAVALNSKENKYDEAMKESEDLLQKARMKKKKKTLIQASAVVALIAVLIASFFIYENIKIKNYRKKIKTENDWTRNYLGGEAKSLKEWSFEAVERFGSIEKGELKQHYSPYRHKIFNRTGNIIEEKLYDQYGNLNTKFVNNYDDKGNIIENVNTTSDDLLIMLWLFKYDDRGNIIEVNLHNSDGLYQKRLYKYDEKENIIEELWYYGSSVNFSRQFLYKHDEKGNKVQEIRYYSDGKIDEETRYKYDENGNMIEYQSFNFDGSFQSRNTYKYDDRGSKIESLGFNSDGSSNWKHLFEYDEKGNLINEYTYDSDNNLKSTRSYVYEYDNKGSWIKKTDFNNDIPEEIMEREIEYF